MMRRLTLVCLRGWTRWKAAFRPLPPRWRGSPPYFLGGAFLSPVIFDRVVPRGLTGRGWPLGVRTNCAPSTPVAVWGLHDLTSSEVIDSSPRLYGAYAGPGIHSADVSLAPAPVWGLPVVFSTRSLCPRPRRHLNREQRRSLIAESLKSDPQLSTREHARRTGAGDQLVGNVRRELVESGQVRESRTSIGADGKSYPASQPKREVNATPVNEWPTSKPAPVAETPFTTANALPQSDLLARLKRDHPVPGIHSADVNGLTAAVWGLITDLVD